MLLIAVDIAVGTMGAGEDLQGREVMKRSKMVPLKQPKSSNQFASLPTTEQGTADLCLKPDQFHLLEKMKTKKTSMIQEIEINKIDVVSEDRTTSGVALTKELLQYKGLRRSNQLRPQPRSPCQWLRRALLCNLSDPIFHHAEFEQKKEEPDKWPLTITNARSCLLIRRVMNCLFATPFACW